MKQTTKARGVRKLVWLAEATSKARRRATTSGRRQALQAPFPQPPLRF